MCWRDQGKSEWRIKKEIGICHQLLVEAFFMNCKLLTVAGVSVNSLEETEDDPCVDSNNVEVTSDSAVKDGASEGTGSKNEDLSRVGVFGSKTEGSGVLVVNLVDVLV